MLPYLPVILYKTVKYSQYVTLPTCNSIQHIVKYSQYVTLPTCNTIQHIVNIVSMLPYLPVILYNT
jgi:hypothetical protein